MTSSRIWYINLFFTSSLFPRDRTRDPRTLPIFDEKLHPLTASPVCNFIVLKLFTIIMCIERGSPSPLCRLHTRPQAHLQIHQDMISCSPGNALIINTYLDTNTVAVNIDISLSSLVDSWMRNHHTGTFVFHMLLHLHFISLSSSSPPPHTSSPLLSPPVPHSLVLSFPPPSLSPCRPQSPLPLFFFSYLRCLPFPLYSIRFISRGYYTMLS